VKGRGKGKRIFTGDAEHFLEAREGGGDWGSGRMPAQMLSENSQKVSSIFLGQRQAEGEGTWGNKGRKINTADVGNLSCGRGDRDQSLRERWVGKNSRGGTSGVRAWRRGYLWVFNLHR